MARSLGVPLDGWGVLACVAGVHAAYRFDELVDAVGFRELARDLRDPRLVSIALAALALAIAAIASPRLVLPLGALSLVGVLYVPLKRFIPKNLLTAGAWSATVSALSLTGLEPTVRTFAAVLALFITVVSNASLCDLPDVSIDRENRVRGFTTMLGVRAAANIAGALGLVASGLAFASGAIGLVLPGLCYAVAGFGFPEALRQHRGAKFWLDAVLVTAGPISLLAR